MDKIEECFRIIDKLIIQIENLEKSYSELLEEYSKIKAINTLSESFSWQKFYENDTIKKAYEKMGER